MVQPGDRSGEKIYIEVTFQLSPSTSWGFFHLHLRARLSLDYLKLYTRRRTKNFRGASKARGGARLERNMPHPRARRIMNRIFSSAICRGVMATAKSTLKPFLVLVAASAMMWAAAMAIHHGL